MDTSKLAQYRAHPRTYAVASRTPDQVNLLVIHTMEGYCIARNARMAQFVDEKDIAYHADNFAYNARSVGIELEAALDLNSRRMFGFPPNDFPVVMLGTLVQMTRWILERYPLIIPDRHHIIGHNEVPSPKDPTKFGGLGGHEDPGHLFPWDAYMASIQ
jgi:N-acetyl-anhydromuramyl-L-alanine amidase AmpD